MTWAPVARYRQEQIIVATRATGKQGYSLGSEAMSVSKNQSGWMGKVNLLLIATSGSAILAFSQAEGASGDNAPEGASVTGPEVGSKQQDLAEIIVTAEKRSERLLDVPIPVTVVNTESLTDTNQLRLQDYFSQVPGLVVAPGLQSSQLVSIRGITTGINSNPTVGITIDDVPYGAATQVGGGGALPVPDLDPSDLARVEVLRGPQGTLYGASSMGGLIKFVTADPTMDRFKGRVEGSVGGVQNRAELEYNARASLNAPVTDNFAVRASGFARQDAGYIDNPVLHINGINEAHVYGGRLGGLWQATDTFALRFSALYQEYKGDGTNDVDQLPGLTGLQQNNLLGTGSYERTNQAYSVTATAKLGSSDLTITSGYNINKYTDSYDLTYGIGPITQLLFGVPGSPDFERNETDKFSQEIRLSVPLGKNFEWLIGGFYTHETSHYSADFLAEDPSNGAIVGQTLNIVYHPTLEEYSAFTDLTVHFTDRFDVQLGGRQSHFRQTYSEVDTGPFVPILEGQPSPAIIPEHDTSSSAFTYLVTPRLKISPDLMVYARVASGYRPGGVNTFPGVPQQYSPDETKNYELGIKTELADHSLIIDGSIYYIDWKNIQVSLVSAQGFGYTGNAGGAKSQGVEVSAELRPAAGLTISGWISLGDAELTEAFSGASSAIGAAGERLPYSSHFSGLISLEQVVPLTGSLEGFAAGDVSYVGDRLGEFSGTPVGPPGTPPSPRTELPSYTKLDLRFGVRRTGLWAANLYINNATDARGLLAGGQGNIPPYGYYYLKPRTIGVTAWRMF
jgi:iron complex outermembrane recepter protein